MYNNSYIYRGLTCIFRLFAKYGPDIRYKALWKKRLIRNGAYWELDEGYLIHDRGLRMIRNIYRELLQIAGCRERRDSEKHAMHRTKSPRESMRLLKCCVSGFN